MAIVATGRPPTGLLALPRAHSFSSLSNAFTAKRHILLVQHKLTQQRQPSTVARAEPDLTERAVRLAADVRLDKEAATLLAEVQVTTDVAVYTAQETMQVRQVSSCVASNVYSNNEKADMWDRRHQDLAALSCPQVAS